MRRLPGEGGFPLPFDFTATRPSSLSSPGLVDGKWPCEDCKGSGRCWTCGGVGTLDDEAWEECLVQPYSTQPRQKQALWPLFRQAWASEHAVQTATAVGRRPVSECVSGAISPPDAIRPTGVRKRKAEPIALV